MKNTLSPLQALKRKQRIEKFKRVVRIQIAVIAYISIPTVLIMFAKVVVHYIKFVWNLVP